MTDSLTDSHVSLAVFRKLCWWAWGSSRAARGERSSWGVCCRSAVRPQKSPWGQVQPNPGLISQPTAPPYIHSSLNSSLFIFETSARLSVPPGILSGAQHTPVSSTSPSALFWYLFLETVLYCFYRLFILTEALYVFLITWFKVCLFPCDASDLPERVQGSHFSYQQIPPTHTHTQTRWKRHKLSVIIQAVSRTQAKKRSCPLRTVFSFDPFCMHVCSVTYECEKKHNCEEFYDLTCLLVVFCGIIVLLLHEVETFLLIMSLLSST